MDGIAALEQIMENFPVPVVMLSNHTEEGAQTTIKALELGAIDFFLKSNLLSENVSEEIISDFLNRIKTIAQGAKIPMPTAENNEYEEKRVENKASNIRSKVDIVIIGCSTGGPSALQSILPRFTDNISVPIIVLQHMPPGFTKPLAERFDTICNLKVKEAEEGDILEAGNIYIAPAGYQTYLNKLPNGRIALKIEDYSPIETVYKPSINVTLNSAAPIYKDRLVSVILTGMGNDGLLGCENVKNHNGRVIVEAEESCVVYGMPKVVFEAGLADFQVPLAKIFPQIMFYI